MDDPAGATAPSAALPDGLSSEGIRNDLPEGEETMLEHLGGRTKLKEFLHAFHAAVLADPLLSEMFARGKPTHMAHLTTFFEEVMGGRQGYTERLGGVASLFDAHARLGITEEQRQRFVDLLMTAADEVRLPDDARFRQSLRTRIDAGSKVSTILSQPGAQRLDPWPPVGRYEW